ncbi:hypothetical protein [Escherichia coli]|uniref:hypothetical protein n=1 Tax=Escherichia coli TaxID=562 RepID=UPI00388D578E
MVTFSKITGLRCWLRCYVSQRQNWPSQLAGQTPGPVQVTTSSHGWIPDSYRLYYRRDRVVPRLAVPSYFRWFMFRLAIAMVGIGSASYLVSLTGIGS